MKNMEGETISISTSSEAKKSFDTICVLVVDDDTTCLTIIAAILKKFRYEVVTVKHPKDALCTLRLKDDAFDLVVSDVHMPDMSGFELQQVISQEFNLPVVLMSADDKEGVSQKGLESGASFFIMKPISPDDLKDLGKFALKKKKTQVVIEETEETNLSSSDNNNSDERDISTSSEDRPNKDTKRKSPRKEGSDEQISGESSESASQKKPKVIWTNALHNKFLEAIRSIGLDRAVPKRILEVMNVPGLTRENVASHLQKYRIFLRRVSDASYKIQCAPDQGSTSSRTARSLLTSSSSETTIPSILMENHTNYFPRANSNMFFTNLDAASSGFGQSRLLSNKGSWLAKPNITIPNIASSGMASSITFPMPQTNFMYQTNYVGYKISNLEHLAKTGHGKKRDQLELPNDAAVNIPMGHEIQNNSVNVAPTPDDCIDLDQLLYELGAYSSCSSPYNPDINTTGTKQLSDVITDFQMLLPSNSTFLGNEGENIDQTSFSPLFDLSEFDITPPQQANLEEGATKSITFADQVNIQKDQTRQKGVDNDSSSGFYVCPSHWENDFVLSFDQATSQQQGHEGSANPMGMGTCSQPNNILEPSTEREDEAFLECLLAPDRFGEDQTLDGI